MFEILNPKREDLASRKGAKGAKVRTKNLSLRAWRDKFSLSRYVKHFNERRCFVRATVEHTICQLAGADFSFSHL
jgi:hypothetical protein